MATTTFTFNPLYSYSLAIMVATGSFWRLNRLRAELQQSPLAFIVNLKLLAATQHRFNRSANRFIYYLVRRKHHLTIPEDMAAHGIIA